MDARQEPLRITLIEDDSDQAEHLCFLLKDLWSGAQITVFSTGEGALEYLFQPMKSTGEAPCALPHLITLDLRLPGMDGLEVLQRLKSHQEFNSIPVIILTASDSQDDLAASYKRGGTVVLRKPFNQEVLEEVIARLRVMGMLKR